MELRAIATAAVVTAILVFVGCSQREVAKVDPTPEKELHKGLPASVNRNIDILFVIDDSGSMKEEQESLAANFHKFVNVLTNIEGGLPNVHLGVVSTNLGGNADSLCGGNGDGGNLIAEPRVRADCTGPNERWIESVDDGTGGRITNYPESQSLAETFSCIAELGTSGCGFEQPLEAMKRALQNPANDGFLRDDAFLAVIFITDEDDCSVEPAGGQAMFANDQCSDWKNPGSCPLGALSSFRCFEFGVECDPDQPRTVGDKEVSGPCQPRSSSPYMSDVAEYARFLRELKGNASLVITAGIIGPPTPVIVEPATLDLPNGQTIDTVALAPSCVQAGAGEAAPAVRLSSFLSQFPTQSRITTICNDDLSDALLQIAQTVIDVVGDACLEGDIADRDGNADNGIQPECAVYDVRFPGTVDESQGDLIPECNGERSNTPCHRFEIDPEKCELTPTQLKIIIERSEDPPIGTTSQIRCVAN